MSLNKLAMIILGLIAVVALGVGSLFAYWAVMGIGVAFDEEVWATLMWLLALVFGMLVVAVSST